jgi:hypothetical protein
MIKQPALKACVRLPGMLEDPWTLSLPVALWLAMLHNALCTSCGVNGTSSAVGMELGSTSRRCAATVAYDWRINATAAGRLGDSESTIRL